MSRKSSAKYDDSNSDASIVLDLGWRQIDKTNNGYIYGRDFSLLIDAIDSILNKTLLNSTGQEIVKDFSKSDSYHKIYKSDFKALFESLLGISFSKALESIEYDKVRLKVEAGDDSVLPKVPILTSTPVPLSINDSAILVNDSISTSQLIDPPNFKKAFTKYKKLNENKEQEIKYRDEVILKLERREAKLKEYEIKISDLQIQNNSLEEDVLYRDKIIYSKDEEIDSKDRTIRQLENQIYQLQKEVQIYKSNNKETISVVERQNKEFFNNALLERLKNQQRAIDQLKKALSENKEIVSKTPIPIKSENLDSSSFFTSLINLISPTFPINLNIKHAWIYAVIAISIIWIFISLPIQSSTSSKSWWEGTFIEPLVYNWLEDNDIDYDYYNLGNVDADYLLKF